MDTIKIFFMATIISLMATAPLTAFADYYVDKDASKKTADGSKDNPFESLKEALKTAAKKG